MTSHPIVIQSADPNTRLLNPEALSAIPAGVLVIPPGMEWDPDRWQPVTLHDRHPQTNLAARSSETAQAPEWLASRAAWMREVLAAEQADPWAEGTGAGYDVQALRTGLDDLGIKYPGIRTDVLRLLDGCPVATYDHPTRQCSYPGIHKAHTHTTITGEGTYECTGLEDVHG